MFRLFVGQKFVDHGAVGTTYPSVTSPSCTSAGLVRVLAMKISPLSSSGAVTRRVVGGRVVAIAAASGSSAVRSAVKRIVISTATAVSALKSRIGTLAVLVASSVVRAAGVTRILNSSGSTVAVGIKRALKSASLAGATATTGSRRVGSFLYYNSAGSVSYAFTRMLVRNLNASVASVSSRVAGVAFRLTPAFSATAVIATASRAFILSLSAVAFALASSTTMTQVRRGASLTTSALTSISLVRSKAIAILVTANTVLRNRPGVNLATLSNATVSALRSTARLTSVLVSRVVDVARPVTRARQIAVSLTAAAALGVNVGIRTALNTSGLVSALRSTIKSSYISQATAIVVFRRASKLGNVQVYAGAAVSKLATVLRAASADSAAAVRFYVSGIRLVSGQATVGFSVNLRRVVGIMLPLSSTTALRKSTGLPVWVNVYSTAGIIRSVAVRSYSFVSESISAAYRRSHRRAFEITVAGSIEVRKHTAVALLLASLLSVTAKRIKRTRGNGPGALMTI